MPKIKIEFILAVILLPILLYIGWQAYNTYLKQPPEELSVLEEETEEEKPAPHPLEKPIDTVSPVSDVGTLDHTGFVERDPLFHSLPVKIKEEEPEEGETAPRETEKEKSIPEPPKEIILPTFTVTGIVWGKADPRAIIDDKVYRTGDIIKGAKILDITEQGIRMLYEGKEFCVGMGNK